MKKMKGKVIALFATLAFILVFVSSINVVTLFHGSHQITDITSPDPFDIDCRDCHSSIQAELNESVNHSSFNCTDCHRFTGTGIVFATHNTTPPYIYEGNQAHAAYTPRCLDCHGKSGFAKPARAFNLDDYGSNYSAHKQFVKQSSSDFDMMVGENEACIACHTNYSLKINYTYFKNISYTKTNSWNLTNFKYDYDTRPYNVSVTHDLPPANGKHVFIQKEKIDCIACHKNIYEALVNGTDGDPYDNLTHSPIEIDYSDVWGGKMAEDHDWRTNNYWGHTRYHHNGSLPRATKVNTTYCKQCHFYTPISPYGDIPTNRSEVHCAEKVSCLTCHGHNKTKDPYNVIKYSGYWGNQVGHSNLMNETETKALTFHGDTCMGCHETAEHLGHASGSCGTGSGTCHGNKGYSQCGKCHWNYGITINIESEPSGKVTRS